jgi:hypothetical protein
MNEDLELVRKIAYESGRVAAEKHRLRVSPYYREWILAGGRKVDCTEYVDKAWLEGYDKQVAVLELVAR